MIRLLVIMVMVLLPFAAAENQTEKVSIDIENLSMSCAKQFECQKSGNSYWFDCEYDVETSDCRCFLGEYSKCDRSRSSIIVESNETAPKSFWITAFAVAKDYSGKGVNIAAGSSLRTKFLVISALVVLGALVYFSTRNNSGKDLKMAVHYHKLAEKAYEKGDSEKSREYYDLSNYYREKSHENEE